MIFQSLLVVLLVFLVSSGQASQSQTYQSGQSFASSLAGNVVGAAKSSDLKSVPGFKTATPVQASLDANSIGDAALKEKSRNEAAQYLVKQAEDRQSFKLDPDHDPLLVDANQIIANPQKALNDKFKESSGSSSGAMVEKIETCEESGDEYLQRCSKNLQVILEITPEKTESVSYCPGHHHKERRGFHFKHWTTHCGGCATRTDVTPKKVEVLSERWIDGCKILEEQVEKGLCRYVSARHSEKDETRIIQGEEITAGLDVTADHFDEYYEYACFKASPKSCAGLRGKGCVQIKSRCKQKMGKQCVLWEQTYSCKSHGKQSPKSWGFANKDSPFCLTGNCADASYEANNEMMEVMSQMAVLREAQNNLREYGAIFRGTARKCTRNCINFRDCCGSGKGWGVSIGLSNCDKDEQELRKLRDKNLCVEIGTYCAEKDPVLRTCIRKKTTFCCFGTKLARLVQEKGRTQIGRSWGSAKIPDCKGFSPEELSRLDFSKVDFSELFEDIKGSMVPKDQGQSLAKVSKERLQNNMALMTKPSGNRTSIQERKKLKEKGL